MKITTSMALAASALLLGISASSAADLRMPVKAPPVATPVPYSWTGFYIGANGGAIWGRTSHNAFTDFIFSPFFTTPPGGIPTIVLGSNGTLPATSGRDTSWLGGGQIGYNWQINQFLIGVEADAVATGLRMSGAATAMRFPGIPQVQTVTAVYTTDIDWMASFRLRLGWAADRVLLYVTGGGAIADIDTTNVVTVVHGPGILIPPGTFSSAASSSATRLGWTVGAGIEWAFADAWSLAAEYRHSDFGRVSSAIVVPDGLGGILTTGTTSTRVSTDQVTLRLNYRFGASPVVARY